MISAKNHLDKPRIKEGIKLRKYGGSVGCLKTRGGTNMCPLVKGKKFSRELCQIIFNTK